MSGNESTRPRFSNVLFFKFCFIYLSELFHVFSKGWKYFKKNISSIYSNWQNSRALIIGREGCQRESGNHGLYNGHTTPLSGNLRNCPTLPINAGELKKLSTAPCRCRNFRSTGEYPRDIIEMNNKIGNSTSTVFTRLSAAPD